MALRFLSGQVLDFLYPKVCGHCGGSFRQGLSNVLCRSCFDSVSPYEDPVCSHCGISLPPRAMEDATEYRCRECGDFSYSLDQVRAFGAYEGALRLAHHSFKFEGMEGLASELAGKMAETIPSVFWKNAEVLVPVPWSPEREREQGYNPTLLLALGISARRNIPVTPLLRKTRPTKPQRALPKEERLKNPKGAYGLDKALTPPKGVILVDDVFTTGATLEECAKVLKAGGAAWVGAAVFGRTP